MTADMGAMLNRCQKTKDVLTAASRAAANSVSQGGTMGFGAQERGDGEGRCREQQIIAAISATGSHQNWQPANTAARATSDAVRLSPA